MSKGRYRLAVELVRLVTKDAVVSFDTMGGLQDVVATTPADLAPDAGLGNAILLEGEGVDRWRVFRGADGSLALQKLGETPTVRLTNVGEGAVLMAFAPGSRGQERPQHPQAPGWPTGTTSLAGEGRPRAAPARAGTRPPGPPSRSSG